MRRAQNHSHDPAQTELVGSLGQRAPHPFRLRAGDVIRFNGRLGRVIRVNECAAAILMNRPVREFKPKVLRGRFHSRELLRDCLRRVISMFGGLLIPI